MLRSCHLPVGSWQLLSMIELISNHADLLTTPAELKSANYNDTKKPPAFTGGTY